MCYCVNHCHLSSNTAPFMKVQLFLFHGCSDCLFNFISIAFFFLFWSTKTWRDCFHSSATISGFEIASRLRGRKPVTFAALHQAEMSCSYTTAAGPDKYFWHPYFNSWFPGSALFCFWIIILLNVRVFRVDFRNQLVSFIAVLTWIAYFKWVATADLFTLPLE